MHSYLRKTVFGKDSNTICCGGFAWHEKELKFSSIWLNKEEQTGSKSDGSQYLSDKEKILVRYCVEQWKLHGSHHIFAIPSYIENQIV